MNEPMTWSRIQEACALLPAELRTQLLGHARVSRVLAMRALDVTEGRLFKKIVDANPDLVHRLPGETRAKYRTAVIARLLLSDARCATRGEVKKP